MNARRRRLVTFAAFLLTASLQCTRPTCAVRPEDAYARRANSVVRDVIAVTHRTFQAQVPLVVVNASELCSVAADDYALTLPGYSGDERLRKEVYASARTLAVRYSLVHKRLYVCEEVLTARLQQNAAADPSMRDCLVDLLLANELTRALDDQYFGLAEQFKRSRRSQPASCLRALMEGHGAYVVDEMALRHGWPFEARCLTDNWCSGWLPEGGPSEYALVNKSDPLRQVGKRALRFLYQSEGPSTVGRLFLKPPEQLNDLLDMPGYLKRIHAFKPDAAGLETALRQCLGLLGLEAWQTRACTPRDVLDRYGLSAGVVDSELPLIRAGRGMILTRTPSAGTFCLLLVHYRDDVPLALDGLLQRANAVLLDAASGMGAAYEAGNASLCIGSDVQTVVRQGRLATAGRSLFTTVAAAGMRGSTAMIMAGYGLSVENRLLTQAINDVLELVEQSRRS